MFVFEYAISFYTHGGVKTDSQYPWMNRRTYGVFEMFAYSVGDNTRPRGPCPPPPSSLRILVALVFSLSSNAFSCA